jgi:hypothetical protein
VPESLTEQALSRRWGDIQAAVTEGLGRKLDHELDKLVPVTAAADDELQLEVHARDVPVSVGGERRGTLTRFVVTTATLDINVRLPLDAGELNHPPLSQITEWAAFARRVERDVVLTEIRRASLGDRDPASLPQLTAAKAREAAAELADGFGELRLIILENTAAARKVRAELDEDDDWDGEVFIPDELPRSAAAASSTGGVAAILVRAGGGPQVKRAGDLSLSWLPADEGGVELALTGRITILGRAEAKLFRRREAPAAARRRAAAVPPAPAPVDPTPA